MATPSTPLLGGAARVDDESSRRRTWPMRRLVAFGATALAAAGAVAMVTRGGSVGNADSSLNSNRPPPDQYREATPQAPAAGSSLPNRGDISSILSGMREEADMNRAPEEKVEFPHLVFVLFDDVGYNDVGYGSSDLHMMTPFIDDLSGQGIRFSSLYAQPICTASRAALLTGKYPIHIKMQHWQVVPQEPWGLPTQEVLLPQYLQKLGYRTYAVGKWHLGHFNNASTPLRRGFEKFFGFYSGGIDYNLHLSEESCDDAYHDNMTCYYDMWDNWTPQIDSIGMHQTALLQSKAEEIIAAHPVDEPMFLYMSYPNAHLPLQVPDSIMSEHNHTLHQVPNLDRRMFAGLMINLDEAIANLTSSLRVTGLYDQTIMIVQSDNGGLISAMGGGNNYPLRGEKKYVYEGGMRVHGFIHSPLIPRTAREKWYDNLFHITDWIPTILEGIIGLSPSDVTDLYPEYIDIDGVNHWNAIVGDMDMPPRDELLHNIDYLDSSGDYLGYYRAALRVGDWKLVWNEKNLTWYGISQEFDYHVFDVNIDGRVTALYNISADPAERYDVKDKYALQMKKMLQKIQQKYLPSMVESGYKDVDPKCYTRWDSTEFVEPWVADTQETSSPMPSARISFESDVFDIEGKYMKDVQDADISNFIEGLSVQLQSFGIQEEDEPHYDSKAWW